MNPTTAFLAVFCLIVALVAARRLIQAYRATQRHVNALQWSLDQEREAVEALLKRWGMR